jgi:lysophospholipase L1-like esterase
MSVLVAGAVTAIGLVVAPGVSQAAKAPPKYYLSLGDSYSVGYQPGLGATAGYTAVVAKKAKMQLENFGCGGATTSSILTANGCVESGYGPVAAFDAVPYPTITQEQAALNFIAAHPGQVGLITVSIGGNDVTACASAGSLAAILTCVQAADANITTNVGLLVSSLNTELSIAGDTAPVVGLTYPDVILGNWVYPANATNQALATDSVAAFDDLINPTLQAAYGAANFVNVTQAPYKLATAGDDTPLTTTHKLNPYGLIPVAVVEICKLTYFCSLGNIHANDKGYKFIGKLVAAHLGLV